MDELTKTRTGAETAIQDVAKLQESIPGLLQGLRTNLVSIYSKDNPLVQQREGLLQDYLTAPSQARAEYLPANQPTVEGRPLNFSPTQLQAMVSARQAAALAPLLGINQQIVGQYGNIGDIISGAGGLYNAQVEAAKTRQTGATDLYKQAVELEKQRISSANANTGLGDLSGLLALLLAGSQQETPVGRPPIESFDTPETSFTGSQPINFGQVTTPGGVNIPTVPGSKYSQPYDFSRISFAQPTPSTGLSLAGNYNNPFANLGINLGI